MAKKALDYTREVIQSDETKLKATVTQAEKDRTIQEPLSVDDDGGSLTVDGSVSLTMVATAQEPGKVVDIAAADTEILASNADRTAFALIVKGTKNVFIKLGTAADNTCTELEPGDALSSDDYTGAVHGFATGGSGKVHVFEV